MTDDAGSLGQFAPHVAAWRRLMASMTDDKGRWGIFDSACHDLADYVTKGLPRTAAVDALDNLATAYGLMRSDPAAVQQIMADAFAWVEDPRLRGEEVVPDPIDEPPYRNGNGPIPPRQPPPLSAGRPGQPYEPKTASLPPLPPIMPKATFLGFYNRLVDYLVDDVLQHGFIYALTGQTGHAKTAVALLIARLVAAADQSAALGIHKVGKGRVLYLVGENPDDVSIRIQGSDAMREDNPEADNISFVPGIFDIERMMAVIEADTAKNGALSLIVVDTSAAYFLGNEELSNTQMGGYARVLRKLTTLPGRPCVLVLCHPVKHVQEPSQLLPRGGSAYLAEMDGNLTLWRTAEDMVVLDHTKLRGPAFQPITFQLKQIKTPKLLDAKGRQISTIEAAVISSKEEDAVENLATDEEDQVLAAMLEDGDNPAGRSFANWALMLGWTDGKGEPYKKKVERVISRLAFAKPKLVTKNRKVWTLTEEGKDHARKAGLRFLREVQTTQEREL